MHRVANVCFYGLVALSVLLSCSSSGTRSFAASIYANNVLADGPVAYYRLGETSGTTAANSSTNGATLNGTYTNFGVSQTSPATQSNINQLGPRPGDASGSMLIQGFESDNIGIRSGANANAQVDVPDNGLLDISGALTLEAWVRREDTQAVNNNSEGIVGKFVGGTNQRSYVLYYNSRSGSGLPSVGMVINGSTSLTGTSIPGQAANNTDFSTGVNIPTGTAGGWQHVAAVYVPNTSMTLYLNGVQIGEKTTGVPSGIFSGSAPLWVGRQFSGASGTSFEGLIDEVAVYDKALTPAQILAHYQSAIPEPACGMLVMSAVALALAKCRRRAA